MEILFVLLDLNISGFFFDNKYKEGDAWHYRFYVTHDTRGLIELFGSNESFIEEL